MVDDQVVDVGDRSPTATDSSTQNDTPTNRFVNSFKNFSTQDQNVDEQ